MDGVSFVPLLKQTGQTPADRAFVWHFPHNYGQTPFSAIRVGPWKLIYHHVDRRLELFNIDADISEKNDLTAQQPEKTKELAVRLTQLLQERGANADRQVHWQAHRMARAGLAQENVIPESGDKEVGILESK